MLQGKNSGYGWFASLNSVFRADYRRPSWSLAVKLLVSSLVQCWDVPGKNPDGTPSAAPRPNRPHFPPISPGFHPGPPRFFFQAGRSPQSIASKRPNHGVSVHGKPKFSEGQPRVFTDLIRVKNTA